jgi:signal transduction histidine kinase
MLRDRMQMAHRNAQRLHKLVNTLLDFARIEANQVGASFAPTNLAQLTKALASSFATVCEQVGIKLVIDCPPLSEPVHVDPQMWEKIVLNLVSNAFKFTFEGEIAVRVRAHGSRVALTVTDTGIGIPPEALPRLFERFYRVDDSHGRSFEGTGIGLSLVRELVELHGGSLEVSSAMNEGSTFTVWLPTGSAHLPAEHIADRASVAPAIAASYVLEASEWRASAETPSIEPASPPPPAPGSDTRRQPRVLVVDDNADMRSDLVRLLSCRFRVETAEHGAIALEMARADPPDLVLSDVMMPVLDGFALLRELREHPRTSHLPVVLLSARTGEESVLEGLDTGADDYLMKPFSARELIARVHTHVEMARLRRQWSSELERANSELEAFSYSVSHDLRAPLRAVDGFSDILLRDYSGSLDADGRNYLTRVRAGTQRMSQLIDDLLSLARIARTSLRRASVDLSEIARGILTEASERDRDRRVDWIVSDGLVVDADSHLLRAMLENLLGNAWKFTAKTPSPTIRVGREERSGELVFFVRDNGAGFDMAYAKRLFAPFQRLHSQKDFQGTGIGLATVQRIVSRHRGRIWAEAEKGSGATFFFTLGDRR